jgi:hypothetical protein
MEDAIVWYLVQLFDYPEVEVRRLALRSLLSWAKFAPLVMDKVWDELDRASDNVVEHILCLEFAYVICQPAELEQHKSDILSVLDRNHFNIRQLAKEILLYGREDALTLTEAELQKVEATNRRPFLLKPIVLEGALQHGRNFVPSAFQVDLLLELRNYDQSDDITKKLYTRVARAGWTAARGMAEESEAHRRYNINTNFDTIEINGPYFQAVQSALNSIVAKEIDQQSYEDEFIQYISRRFRLYDPAESQIQVTSRPADINWINAAQSDEDFLSFTDLDQQVESLWQRDKEWVTLYEDGHQRNLKGHVTGDLRTCYFRLVSFLVDPTRFHNVKTVNNRLQHLPIFLTENVYIFELSHSVPASSTFPVNGIRPILGVSNNRFRGSEALSIATLAPDVVQELQLTARNACSLDYELDGELAVHFYSWQEEFDQGRRVQRSRSAGVGLRIRRDLLDRYLARHGYEFYVHINLRRSADKYKPEPEMHWETIAKTYRIGSL